ncbi:MAG: hypothetical protein ABSB95_04410 [Dissulfurispiraceae bacterium]
MNTLLVIIAFTIDLLLNILFLKPQLALKKCLSILIPLANNDGWKKDIDSGLWWRYIDDRRRGIAIRVIITPAMLIAAAFISTSSVLGTSVVMFFHTFMVIFAEGRGRVYTTDHCG